MDRRILYAALLVLSTAVGSSLLITYSTQRGLGELLVTPLQIESSQHTNATVRIYSQYYPTYDAPIPVVLSIHGPDETASNLYAYNIELARRNLTVVSIEIENLNEIVTSMDEESLNQTGYICAEVLDYIRENYNVDDDIFGILTHAEGFQVALRMLNFTGSPKAFVAIGALGEVDTNLTSSITGNFLMAVGEYPDEFSLETGQGFMEGISGLPEIEIGRIYGNLEREDAFEIISTSEDRSSELTSSSLVAQSCEWMVKGLQGIPHFEKTLNVSMQIYQYQRYADWILVASVTGIGCVVLILVLDLLRPVIQDRRANPQSDGN